MIRVYQTITGVAPERGIFGNCFQACIASVLEMNLDDVPHFAQLSVEKEVARGVPPEIAFKESTDWWYLLNDWLAARGLYYVQFGQADQWHEDIIARLGYHLIIGPSPRGDYDHVVVGQAGAIVHDPREDANGAGLRSIRAFGLFIPRDPSGVRG